jgi:hypothetical protein
MPGPHSARHPHHVTGGDSVQLTADALSSAGSADAARAAYAALAAPGDAVISVTAPVGRETTGNLIFVVPGSMLGAPGVSAPVLNDGRRDAKTSAH